MSYTANPSRSEVDHVTAIATGAPGKRNRAAEPSEQRRAAARAAKVCITPGCGAPTEHQRCLTCTRKVEAATGRYQGRGEKGPPTKLETNLTDLRYSLVELTGAIEGVTQVSRLVLTPREIERALGEPLAKLLISVRFGIGVLASHGRAPLTVADETEGEEPASRSAWSARYFERKAAGLCVRCPRVASDDSVLCSRCYARRRRIRRRARR